MGAGARGGHWPRFFFLLFPLVGDISCLANLLTSFSVMIDTLATERDPDETRRLSDVAPNASRRIRFC
jgi:hypothetical protein